MRVGQQAITVLYILDFHTKPLDDVILTSKHCKEAKAESCEEQSTFMNKFILRPMEVQ